MADERTSRPRGRCERARGRERQFDLQNGRVPASASRLVTPFSSQKKTPPASTGLTEPNQGAAGIGLGRNTCKSPLVLGNRDSATTNSLAGGGERKPNRRGLALLRPSFLPSQEEKIRVLAHRDASRRPPLLNRAAPSIGPSGRLFREGQAWFGPA